MPLKVSLNLPICTLNRTKETKGITECFRALAICVAAVKTTNTMHWYCCTAIVPYCSMHAPS